MQESDYFGKPIYKNLHPVNNKYSAILNGNGTSLGFITFKNAKRVAPLDKFKFRKFQKIDTTKANKKYFHENPHLKEFAKPFLPAGTASEAQKEYDILLKEKEEQMIKLANAAAKKVKKSSENPSTAINETTSPVLEPKK